MHFKKFLSYFGRKIKFFISDVYFKIVPGDIFVFEGEKLRFFRHTYNRAWENERTVEVPIANFFLKKYKGKRILEVGNVLRNYLSDSHDVVDKYEKGRGILNEDIISFKPERPYDLVISVSTMEHVGWDENPKSPEKILAAVENIKKNCLSPDGVFVMEVPLGYNPHLDNFLREKKLGFDNYLFLKRVTGDNQWRQVSEKDVEGSKFGEPFNNANAEVVCIYGPIHHER